uniref:Uncharacterized protein n=1 Tax=Oryza brachyantha TaxID=4533 RepID=J3ND26_ORYBR
MASNLGMARETRRDVVENGECGLSSHGAFAFGKLLYLHIQYCQGFNIKNVLMAQWHQPEYTL